MAYYKITTDKKGNLKAKIQVYGNDLDSGGKRLYTKTVYNTDGLTESKFKKHVDRMSVEFEASIEDSYRSGAASVMNGVLTFSQLSNEWIIALENNLSESYYLRAVEVKEKFEAYLKEQKLYNRPISDIKVRDVQMFLNSFMTKKPEFTGMVQLKEPLPKKVSFRELDRENIIPRSTSYYLNHREGRISKAVATKICECYNLEFDDYFDEIVKIKQYSQETIKGYRRVLRTIFNEAVRFEWITKNPVCGTKVSAGNSNTSLRPVTEKAVFSIAETKEFLKAVDSIGEEHINNKIMIKLMLLTGIRNAELHGLRWSDIDFEKKLIHIKRNRLYSKRLGTYEKCPKTKTSERDIPLSDGLIADLKVYMDWFRLADDDFDNKLDNYYLAVNIMREPESVHHIGSWLKKFEERNGFKAVTCHGLRHTYCSMLLSQNVPIQTVSKYMGHSDSSITLQVYSHFIPDTQEKVVNAINLIESEE